MHVFVERTLRVYWESHAECRQPLRTWLKIVENCHWRTPQDIKEMFPKASILPDNRVVFNIVGGNYRLVVKINYERGWVFVRFIGTHAEYDKIDATEV